MTDNEIIKALEICSTTGSKCTDCPAFVKVDRSNCNKAFKGAVAIINRQKEELTKNEKIIKAADDLIDCQKKEIERLLQKLQQPQSEAVKEFADLVVKNIRENVTPIPQQRYLVNMCIQVIENIKKEMVGEG